MPTARDLFYLDGCSFALAKSRLRDDMTRGFEAFATVAARDQALGRVDAYTEYVATTSAAVKAAGRKLAEIACGHGFGEDGFLWIAPPLVHAVAREMTIGTGWPGAIIIGRVCYEISMQNGRVTLDAHPMLGITTDKKQTAMTMNWLRAAFARRLGI
jgi:hypothetical protein